MLNLMICHMCDCNINCAVNSNVVKKLSTVFYISAWSYKKLESYEAMNFPTKHDKTIVYQVQD